MKAVILAAGKGSRLKPFTENIPKVMLPVANKPILEYVINALIKNGIYEIVIVIGYRKESILEYFGNGKRFGVEIKYAFQKEQIGTAHALLQAEKHIDDAFILLPGDNIIDEKSLSLLINSKYDISLLVKKHPQPSKYGVVEIEDGVVKSIVEKPSKARSNIVSTGIYKLKEEIIDILKECATEGINDLTSVIQNAIRVGYEIKAIEASKWADIVYPWDLLNINEKILQSTSSSISGKIEENVVIKGKVLIGTDTIIHSGCYIVGPVIIGNNCEIGPNVCIFPSSSIGNNATIYPFTEIRNSILMDNVNIGSNSMILNSVIGSGSKIGSHFSTIVGEALMEANGEYISIDNIGSFIGDGVEIGSNVVVYPGKRIGGNCKIGVGNIVREDIARGCKVI